jgi:hypothetical protein
MGPKKITVDLGEISKEPDEVILDMLLSAYTIEALEETISVIGKRDDTIYVDMPFEPRFIRSDLVLRHAKYWLVYRRRQRFEMICAYAEKILGEIKHDNKRA